MLPGSFDGSLSEAKRLRVFVSVATAMLLVLLGIALIFPALTTRAQVRAQPFFLERTLDGPDEHGRIATFGKEIVARRSDGATMRAPTVGDWRAGNYVRQITFPDGRSVTVFDPIRVKNTWETGTNSNAPDRKEKLVNFPRDCGVRPPDVLLRFDKSHGQDVVVIQNVVPEKYRVTRWMAPSLACEDLYYKSEALQGDLATMVSTEAKTVQFVLGEPDAKWFDTAAVYEEVEPSEAQRRLFRRLDIKVDKAEAALLEGRGKADDVRYRVQKAK